MKLLKTQDFKFSFKLTISLSKDCLINLFVINVKNHIDRFFIDFCINTNYRMLKPEHRSYHYWHYSSYLGGTILKTKI